MKHKRRKACCEKSEELIGVLTEEEGQKEVFYTVNYFKNSSTEKELFPEKNITEIEPHLERPDLGFVLLKRTRHRKLFKRFPTKLENWGRRFNVGLCSRW